MSRAVSGRRSAIRNATSESCRISLSVSWLIGPRAYRPAADRHRRPSGRDAGALEVLVRRAVVAIRERRALARLALAGRRVAVGDPALERPGLDLLLDELDRGADALVHGPRHLRLDGDREVAPDVLEEGAVGLREVVRIGRETLHRRLARGEHVATVFELCRGVHVRVDEIL